MQDAGVILTKNRVLEKTRSMLEIVQQQQVVYIHDKRLDTLESFTSGPKISRGQNYLGLPYLILDNPRFSSGGTLFFIRSMFWCGNFFSSTLHLSGKISTHMKENIKNSYELLSSHYIGINEDPWMHHFGEDNYRKVSDVSKNEFETYCETSKHVKLAARWPLSEWHDAHSLLFEHWKFLLGCVT